LNCTIRHADLADAAICAKIYRPYVTETIISFETEAPDVAEMAARIENFGNSHAWLIAETNGWVAGYAYASPHRTRAAYATSADVAVYVHPDFAGKGIGKQLYGELFATLKQKQLHAVFAGIVLPNAASIALHEATGFTPVGTYREVGWKLGAWHDVSWWQRLL
jgi:L-amino acid N-acyltransferase YncA